MHWTLRYRQKLSITLKSKDLAGVRVRSSFWSTLARELLDAIHFPTCSSASSAAPQTFTLTPASLSHSTSTSLHSIGFINSFRFFCCCFVFFLSRRGVLQSIARPPQSTAMPLERAAGHIKGTHPPCLFQLPWENVSRSTTLLHVCEWHHLINYSWEKLHDFINAVFPITFERIHTMGQARSTCNLHF